MIFEIKNRSIQNFENDLEIKDKKLKPYSSHAYIRKQNPTNLGLNSYKNQLKDG